jgi:hypothetical protein
MNWLTSPWLFYGGFPFALAAPFVLTWYFGRAEATGKTYHQSASETVKQTFDDIRGQLEQLLKSGFDQGFVIFQFKDGGRFIQFRKYIHAKGDYGLELAFPKADWSVEFFPLVARCCDRLNISHTVGPHTRGDGLEFLHADLGRDTDMAFRLVCSIVDDVFRISRDTQYTLEWDAVDVTGALIESPGQSPGKRERQYRQEFFKKAGFYMSDIPVAIIWLFAFTLGVIGMAYGLIWWLVWIAASANADWGFIEGHIGGLELAIRNFQLFNVIAFVSTYLLDRTPAFRRIRKSVQANRKEKGTREKWWQGVTIRFVLTPLLLAATAASWIRW